MGAQIQRGAYSRVSGASTAFRPVAVGVGGAERGVPMSQSAYSRLRGAATAERRRSAGLLGDRTHSESNGFPGCAGLCGGRTRSKATGAPVVRRQAPRTIICNVYALR